MLTIIVDSPNNGHFGTYRYSVCPLLGNYAILPPIHFVMIVLLIIYISKEKYIAKWSMKTDEKVL